MTSITEWRLAPGVTLTSGTELSEEMRHRCRCAPGETLLSRPNSRFPSKILSAPAAKLVAVFATPTMPLEAALLVAHQQNLPPETALETVMTTVGPLIRDGWIVDHATATERTHPTLKVGSALRGLDVEVVRCIHLLDDTEIYQVANRDGLAVLKLERRPDEFPIADLIDHEAHILELLPDDLGPRLLGTGTNQGRAYVLMSWLPGNQIGIAAPEIRAIGGMTSGLNLAVRALDEYVRLHAAGVLHVDVNPNNVLVAPSEEIRLIDFGLSLAAQLPFRPPRRGMAQFFDPQLAASILAREDRPDTSQLSEQYSLGALAYLLITGRTYIDFSASREEMMSEIASIPPTSFATESGPRFRGVEDALSQALAKAPQDRFGSVGAFTDALRAARPKKTRSVTSRPHENAMNFYRDLLAIDPSAHNFDAFAPSASFSYGAAGIAYALLRHSQATGDSHALARADAWAVRATDLVNTSRVSALTSIDLGVTLERIGSTSLFFGEPGVHLVQALIANAMADESTHWLAIQRFIATVKSEKIPDDLTLGSAGIILGCAVLVGDGVTSGFLPSAHPLFEVARVARHYLAHLSTVGIADLGGPQGYLGMAHGVAGAAYAALAWSKASGDEVPPWAYAALDFLEEKAIRNEEGAMWPTLMHSSAPMNSWCHGAPGYVFLWNLAHTVGRREKYAELALAAARATSIGASLGATLCCGDAGRMMALLQMHARTGETEWRASAHRLAARAMGAQPLPRLRLALLKGDLGAAFATLELDSPAFAAFPFGLSEDELALPARPHFAL